MSHALRLELAEAYGPVLAELLAEARRAGVTGALVGYVVRLLEPTGYMLALGLERRYGEPRPEDRMRKALECRLPRDQVLAGIATASSFTELLAGLSPNLARLAAGLTLTPGDADAPADPAPPLRVLVAAGGGAEILPLPNLHG